tara:strand:+ start:1643 stop:1924 length:282 start_codon:yes stop_codon:yes gene_type:complete
MIRLKLEMVFALIAFALLVGIAGCSERIRYKTINVPVITLPSVPNDLLDDYQGAMPMAGINGNVCFDAEQVRNLQSWMIFHKTQNDALKELLR